MGKIKKQEQRQPLSQQSSASPTSTARNCLFRAGDFLTLADALDYAAISEAGVNFYNGKGQLDVSATYGVVREQALVVARRMQSQNLPRGSKVSLIADTTLDFIVFFFACQYAGLVPVPLPAIVNTGGHDAFVRQIKSLISDSQSRLAFASDRFADYLKESCEDLPLDFSGTYETFRQLAPESDELLQPLGKEEVAYIQYTSGSTSAPRGVMVQSKAVMANLEGILKYGLQVNPNDRFLSWLPFYHDMGLVGLMLSPMASQTSVDYIGTREFAVRPRLWLSLMSKTKATISFSPPFGYELCSRRLSKGKQAEKYDLSSWRIAGVGAEMIRHSVLIQFAEVLKPSGFQLSAFLACYGMAESSLAVSFSELHKNFIVDEVDRERYANHGLALKPDTKTQHKLSFVACGYPLPAHEIQIRDECGQVLESRHAGIVFIRGPSLMCGYLGRPDLTARTLDQNGWLNTGDLGYMDGGRLFVTGRHKDLIIINGRNIWPQDLERIAECQPGIRPGDVLAFALSEEGNSERAVIVMQCREKEEAVRIQLIKRVQSIVLAEFGIHCDIELVPPRTLPRTSSGKLSRSQAKINFIRSGHQDVLISSDLPKLATATSDHRRAG